VVCAHGKKILYWEKAQVEASQQAQSYFSKWVAEGSAFGTLSEYGARFILLDHNDKVALRLETVHTAGDERLRKHLAANGKKVSPSNVSSSFYLVSAPKLTWLCRRKISSRVGLFERADTCRPVCFDLDLDDWDAGVSHLDMIRVFEEHSIPFFNPHLIDLCDLDELEEQATPFYKQKCRSDSMSSLHNAERRSFQRSVEVSLT
jgi:hypothetical protein